MSWTVRDVTSGFDDHAAEWDDFSRAVGDHILLSSDFIRRLIRFFPPSDSLVLARCDDPGRSVMLLLGRAGNGGWASYQPAQQPLGTVLGQPASLSLSSSPFADLFSCLPGVALSIGVTKQDPDFSCFGALRATDSSAATEVIDSIETAKVSVSSTFDEYWSARPKKFRSNVARRQRKLERDGIEWRVDTCAEPAGMAAQVTAYGELESAGWKGHEGTAVHASNTQGRFYTDVLEHFAARGEAIVYELRYDDQVVASQLCLRRGTMLVFLKMAYDEGFRAYSPGFQLRAEILRRVFAKGQVRRVEFYGKIREGWTLNWTDEIRQMYHLNAFRYPWLRSARDSAKALRSKLRRSSA